MYALNDDPFFDVLARYPDCVVDYGLFRTDMPYRGEASHREALECAMRAFCGEDGEPMWTGSADEAVASPMEINDLLSLPDAHKDGAQRAEYAKRTDGVAIPYREAFLLPPHGGNLRKADFLAVNRALFPCGTDGLTAYAWSTGWSDYFDDGREWWGTGCWSVYDARMDRYAVILASATD